MNAGVKVSNYYFRRKWYSFMMVNAVAMPLTIESNMTA